MDLFREKYNKYTKNFLDELHSSIENSVYVNSSYITKQDYIYIDELIIKSYPRVFHQFYNEINIEIMHNPDMAKDFNSTYILLLMEAIRLVYVIEPSFSYMDRSTYIKILFSYIDKKLLSLKTSNLTNIEIINDIKDDMFNEYEKIIKQKNINVSPLRHTLYQKIREYSKKKYNESDKFIAEKFESKFNFSKFSKLVILNCVIAIFLPIIMNFLNINWKIIYLTYTIYFVYIIIISIVFPYFIILIKKKFRRIKYLNRPYDYYSLLGVDNIKIYLSISQIKYGDPELENIVLPIIADLRFNLMEEYGFVLSSVRVQDDPDLKTGYKFLFRDKEFYYIELDISNNIIYKEDAEKYNIKLPENIREYCAFDKVYYQVDSSFCKDLSNDSYYTGAEFFKNIFKQLIMKNIDIIFTLEETVALFELYKISLNSKKIQINTINKINEIFNFYMLKRIFIKLLQKNYSLKDIDFIFEKIIQYSQNSNDSEYIAFQICKDIDNINSRKDIK